MAGIVRGGEWALGGDLDLMVVAHSLSKDTSAVGTLPNMTSGGLALFVEVTCSLPLLSPSLSGSWSDLAVVN